MTDEQLQEWHTVLLTEAQRENYVNHNLEIVRHYRTEAISRAPAFDIERNAIDAAIARHGLYAANGETLSGCPEPNAAPEEEQPPPMRRPRMEQPEQGSPSTAPVPEGNAGGEGRGFNCERYVALTHIYSANSSSSGGSSHNNNNNNEKKANNNNNNEPEDAEINEIAIKKTIDSLGLRRT